MGGKENTWHCNSCGFCMGIALKDSHICSGKNGLKDDCVVCMEDMFTSRSTSTQLKCGHYIHSKCFYSYSKT